MHTKLWAIQTRDNGFAYNQMYDDSKRALIFFDKGSADAYLSNQKELLAEARTKTISTSNWTWKGKVTTIQKFQYPLVLHDFDNAVVKEVILFL